MKKNETKKVSDSVKAAVQNLYNGIDAVLPLLQDKDMVTAAKSLIHRMLHHPKVDIGYDDSFGQMTPSETLDRMFLWSDVKYLVEEYSDEKKKGGSKANIDTIVSKSKKLLSVVHAALSAREEAPFQLYVDSMDIEVRAVERDDIEGMLEDGAEIPDSVKELLEKGKGGFVGSVKEDGKWGSLTALEEDDLSVTSSDEDAESDGVTYGVFPGRKKGNDA